MAEQEDNLDSRDSGAADDRTAPPDPRLLAIEPTPLSPLVLAGKVAGWVGFAALLVALFWTGITKTLGTGPKVLLVLAIVGIGFWLATNINAVVQQARARGVQAVLNSVLFTVFVVGIIVMANYVAGRHHVFRADWSEAKLTSLASGSLAIIKDLKEDVTITAFVSPDYYGAEQLRTMLKEYEIHSKHVKVRTYDPKLALDKVEQYNRPYDGTIFVEAGGRKEEVQGGTEEQISSAILAVTTGEKTKVYMLTGHGEQSLDAFGEQGLSVLKRYLENEQYQVESISLATEKEPQVPADCAVLAIIGAKQKPMAKEMAAIKQYVEQGGNLFLAIATPPAYNFADILEPYGVRPLAGVVIDPAQSLEGNPQVPAVVQPKGHDIVSDLTMIALPTSIAFDVQTPEPPMPGPGAPPPPPAPAQAIMESTGSAWLETSTSGPVKKDPNERTGPLAMAVAIDLGQQEQQPEYPGAPPPPEPEGRKARIVAIGDYDFVRDDLYQMGLRSNIFLATSSFAWLTKNERLVTIPPQEPPDRTMVLATAQKGLAILISAVAIPLLVLVTGLVVWWRRR